MATDQWWDCYDGGWGDELVPEAFAHPAKVAPELSKRIYDHAMQEGWLHEGDTVLDPFGGIAGFALQAMVHGLAWVGVELEEKFVDLGNKNLELWRKRYALWPKLGVAVLLQGDSRKLAEVVGQAAGVVSSPPYSQTGVSDHEGQTNALKGGKFQGGGDKFLYADYGTTPDNLGNLRATTEGFEASISSPPYAESTIRGGKELATVPIGTRWANGHKSVRKDESGYGSTPGNLGNLHSSPEGFDSVISSPPYAETINATDKTHDVKTEDDRKRILDQTGVRLGGGQLSNKNCYGCAPGQLGSMPAGDFDAAVSSPPYAESMDSERNGIDWTKVKKDYPGRVMHEDRIAMSERHHTERRYGDTNGQLRAMPSGDFSASVSSPPYEGQMVGHGNEKESDIDRRYAGFLQTSGERLTEGRARGIKAMVEGYGSVDDASLGNSSGDDFWSAARLIVEQTYQVLRPGGHAIWVVKSFVRNKQIVDFPSQWRQLCEACGFVTLHEHHAMLVSQVAQLTLEGTRKYKERKSFFRRLAESKGSPKIDFEVVLCMAKPGNGDTGISAAVSSPPYAEALSNPSDKMESTGAGGPIHPRNYGKSDGNLGNMKVDTGSLESAIKESKGG